MEGSDEEFGDLDEYEMERGGNAVEESVNIGEEGEMTEESGGFEEKGESSSEREMDRAMDVGGSQRAAPSEWSEELVSVDIPPFTLPSGPRVEIPDSAFGVFELMFTADILMRLSTDMLNRY